MKNLIFTLLLTNSIFAITMTPLYETMDSRKNIKTIFKIKNPTADPVAVEISVLKLIDTNGKKEQREATNMVKAYPTQLVLDPKETKSIRVRYMGSGLPQNEEVYRVIAKELDIDVSGKQEEKSTNKIKAHIKMRFSYEGLLFVHQPNSKVELFVESIQLLGNILNINIKNSGTASTVPNAKNYNFIVKVKNKEYALTENDLKGTEFRRVLTGKTNTFQLKNITSVPVQQIESMRIETK